VSYRIAKQKVVQKRLIAAGIAIPAIISTAISLLKMIYFRLDDGSQLAGMLAKPFKQLVYWVYENTQFFSIFWKRSPTPNQMDISEVQNIYFFVIYLSIFVGFAFYASAGKLSLRLAAINEKIENQLIEESIKGKKGRTREEIERSTVIPKNSIFSQFHQFYLAPIVTAIIGAILIKLLGV
jgi:hypothetical protein